MVTYALKPQVPRRTAKLVPEALKHKVHVVKDPALIQLLGRSKFVDMVVFNVVGWQQGVSHLFASSLQFYFFLLPLSIFKVRISLSLFIYLLRSNLLHLHKAPISSISSLQTLLCLGLLHI